MEMNNFERKTLRKYHIELAAGIGAYILLLFAARKFYAFADTFIAKLGLSLLPMIGAVAVAWIIGRAIVRADELQRRHVLEIIAWSSGVTMLITFGYGFLEFGIGLPKLSMFVVWPVMGLAWIITSIIYALVGKVQPFLPWTRK